MTICTTTTHTIVRGATLDIAMRMPDGFPDGHLAGWVPTSQIRTTSGQLIATLDAQWVDPLTTRYLRLRHADTSDWPVVPAVFDIRLTSPAGYRMQSLPHQLSIVRGETRV